MRDTRLEKSSILALVLRAGLPIRQYRQMHAKGARPPKGRHQIMKKITFIIIISELIITITINLVPRRSF